MIFELDGFLCTFFVALFFNVKRSFERRRSGVASVAGWSGIRLGWIGNEAPLWSCCVATHNSNSLALPTNEPLESAHSIRRFDWEWTISLY
jgi:hypothetical protein